MSSSAPADTINAILGVEPGSTIAQLRNRKPELARQLQDYYDALFHPSDDSLKSLGLVDRLLIAARVAAHTGSSSVVEWYAGAARDAGAGEELIARARDLSTEWTDTTPLGAAVRHADMLTTSPSIASEDHLRALEEAGFSPAGIVTLSQVVAFVSYQIRLIAGLRALGETS